ncbi:MAG: tetratricopeptide repeat protein [Prosthecobacter sp.]|nr:tetratricopeptide repeat protein [Prosthecobacter sp.]
MKGIKLIFVLTLAVTPMLHAQEARVVEIENIVQAAAGAEGAWQPAAREQALAVRDRIRTRQRSRATVRLTSLYTMRMEQLTTIEISPQLLDDSKPKLDLTSGALFIFSREQSGEIDIKTPAANGALRGTQLFVSVGAGGRTFYQVLEGSVQVSNPQGSVLISSGEAAEATPGQMPKRTAVIEAKNILQWALYYPAVVDPAELESALSTKRGAEGDLDSAGIAVLPPAAATPLAAYAQGDLLHAVGLLPQTGTGGVAGRCLDAAILLAVGRVDEAQGLLGGVPKEHSMRRALERVIAAVRFEEAPEWSLHSLTSASEALAESYYLQSRSRLEEALKAAQRATELSPENGHAWVRLAELEFSFGHTRAAKSALQRGLELTPWNAQAHALHGFVLSAENEIAQARQAFERAVRLDGALGSGWLGLGLTKIKRGDVAAGRADVQTAATVEPLRSIYHSYLGKVFSVEGRREDALRDLGLARQLDPNDPTPWLYSAIESQQHNETNRAIDEMQESIRLNDNRRVYRSEFLLDQDRAVRGANLARIYQNNGMSAVAVREAARAVQSDYTNASAHLFLANAFNALRDPKRISLRYETPWFNELLLSNLLSPVGGGPLSQYVSQQEYSKLLEADGMGASLAHEWRGTGEVRSTASVFGTYGDVSFGIDYAYRDDHGTRNNNEASLQEIYAQFKWQASPDDTFYFLGKWAAQESGDNFDTYNNQPLAPQVFFQEDQRPGLLLAGWNHRWAPGSHTLFLAGRLSAEQRLSDPSANQLLIARDDAAMRPGLISTVGFFDVFTDPALAGSVGIALDGVSLTYSPALLGAIAPFIGSGSVLGVATAPFEVETQRRFEIYTAELQHIQQMRQHTLLAGARFQAGEFETMTRMTINRPTFLGGFSTPAAEQSTEVDFQRVSLYAYDFWSPAPWLTLIGGIAWDHIEHPDNFRNPPVNDRQREDERVSGKAGLILTPSRWFQVRGAYTQGLGGVTFDESVRLEPVQIAGFNQSYRTIISESIAGSVETPRFQSWGLSFEGSLPTKTWWGITGNVIEQEVDRTLGVFDGYSSGVFPITPAYFPGSTPQRLSYREESIMATVNQLVSREWALGTSYRITQSELRTTFPDIPQTLMPNADVEDRAVLHEIGLSLNWNSPRGFFARMEGNWYSQYLGDDPRGLPAGTAPRQGDEFWQFNAFAGYRFHRNMCEVSAGLLNIGDQDYQLSPLSPYFDIARERTFVVRCRFSF